MRRTKIICTMGPAVDNEDTLRQLMQSGMNVARLNFSHGNHEEQLERIQRIKRLREELQLPIALLLDTKGPEIRVTEFAEGAVELQAGQQFTLDARQDEPGDINRVAVTLPGLSGYLQEGTRILIDDGKIALDVKELHGDAIICTVINGGRVSNRKSINIPNTPIPMPYLSDRDRSDLLFGIQQDIDYVAASFVRSADDVKELKAFLRAMGGASIHVISKIENTEGVNNLDEIIAASEGIMVARGDLGVEIPFEEVPIVQKTIISKCNRAGKIVVTATQMLESMTQSPRPTRAEVSDIANAIHDGTTAIMLSGETAAGKYPVEAVQAMANIAIKTEASINYKTPYVWNEDNKPRIIPNAICNAACDAANYLGAKAIIVVTRSGKTAEQLATFRPECPIIACTVNPKGMYQINLCWDVMPIPASEQSTTQELVEYAKREAIESGIVSKGDTVVFITGSAVDTRCTSDTLRIMTL